MKVTYDEEVDILVVGLASLRRSTGAKELAPGVYIDLADDGTVLGLEIMGASKRYPREELLKHPARYDEPIALADAAHVLGVTPQALQKAILRGRLDGKKVGKTWTTTIEALTRYGNARARSPKVSGAVVAERKAAPARSGPQKGRPEGGSDA